MESPLALKRAPISAAQRGSKRPAAQPRTPKETATTEAKGGLIASTEAEGGLIASTKAEGGLIASTEAEGGLIAFTAAEGGLIASIAVEHQSANHRPQHSATASWRAAYTIVTLTT